MWALLAVVFAAPAPPELATLNALTGAPFMCDGKVNVLGREIASRARLSARWDVDGRWLSVRFEEEKSPATPRPHRTSEMWGHAGRFIRTVADNGGGWAQLRSDGWVDDRLVWEGQGETGGMQTKVVEFFSLDVQTKSLAIDGSISVTDGTLLRWSYYCRRQ
jgi:hypothetical protein